MPATDPEDGNMNFWFCRPCKKSNDASNSSKSDSNLSIAPTPKKEDSGIEEERKMYVLLAGLLVSRSLPPEMFSELLNRNLISILWRIASNTSHEEILDTSGHLLALGMLPALPSATHLEASNSLAVHISTFRKVPRFPTFFVSPITLPLHSLVKIRHQWKGHNMPLRAAALDELRVATCLIANLLRINRSLVRASMDDEVVEALLVLIGGEDEPPSMNVEVNPLTEARAQTQEDEMKICSETLGDPFIKAYLIEILSFVTACREIITRIASPKRDDPRNLEIRLLRVIVTLNYHSVEAAPERGAHTTAHVKSILKKRKGEWLGNIGTLSPLRRYLICDDVIKATSSLIKTARAVPHLRVSKLTTWVRELVAGNVIDLVLEYMRRRDADKSATFTMFEFDGKSQEFIDELPAHYHRMMHRGHATLLQKNGRPDNDWRKLVLEVIEELSFTQQGACIVQLYAAQLLSLLHSKELISHARIMLTSLAKRVFDAPKNSKKLNSRGAEAEGPAKARTFEEELRHQKKPEHQKRIEELEHQKTIDNDKLETLQFLETNGLGKEELGKLELEKIKCKNSIAALQKLIASEQAKEMNGVKPLDVLTEMQYLNNEIASAIEVKVGNLQSIGKYSSDAASMDDMDSQLVVNFLSWETRTLGLLEIVTPSKSRELVMDQLELWNGAIAKRQTDSSSNANISEKAQKKSNNNINQELRQSMGAFWNTHRAEVESEKQIRQREAGILLGTMIAISPKTFAVLGEIGKPTTRRGELLVIADWFRDAVVQKPDQLRGLLATFNTMVSMSNKLRTFMIDQRAIDSCFYILYTHRDAIQMRNGQFSFSTFRSLTLLISQLLSFGEEGVNQMGLEKPAGTHPKKEDFQKPNPKRPNTANSLTSSEIEPSAPATHTHIDTFLAVFKSVPPWWTKELIEIPAAMCGSQLGIEVLHKSHFFRKLLRLLEQVEVDKKGLVLKMMAQYLRAVAFVDRRSENETDSPTQSKRVHRSYLICVFELDCIRETMKAVDKIISDPMYFTKWSKFASQFREKIPIRKKEVTEKKDEKKPCIPVEFGHSKADLTQETIPFDATLAFVQTNSLAVLESLSCSPTARKYLIGQYTEDIFLFLDLFAHIHNLVIRAKPSTPADPWQMEHVPMLLSSIEVLYNLASHGVSKPNLTQSDHNRLWEFLDVTQLGFVVNPQSEATTSGAAESPRRVEVLETGVVLFLQPLHDSPAVSEELVLALLDAVTDSRSDTQLQQKRKHVFQLYQMMSDMAVVNSYLLNKSHKIVKHSQLIPELKGKYSFVEYITGIADPHTVAVEIPVPDSPKGASLNKPIGSSGQSFLNTLRMSDTSYSQMSNSSYLDLEAPVSSIVRKPKPSYAFSRRLQSLRKGNAPPTKVTVLKAETDKFLGSRKYKAEFFKIVMTRLKGTASKFLVTEVLRALLTNDLFIDVVESVVEMWLKVGSTQDASTVTDSEVDGLVKMLIAPCEPFPSPATSHTSLNLARQKGDDLRAKLVQAVFKALENEWSWKALLKSNRSEFCRVILLKLLCEALDRTEKAMKNDPLADIAATPSLGPSSPANSTATASTTTTPISPAKPTNENLDLAKSPWTCGYPVDTLHNSIPLDSKESKQPFQVELKHVILLKNHLNCKGRELDFILLSIASALRVAHITDLKKVEEVGAETMRSLVIEMAEETSLKRIDFFVRIAVKYFYPTQEMAETKQQRLIARLANESAMTGAFPAPADTTLHHKADDFFSVGGIHCVSQRLYSAVKHSNFIKEIVHSSPEIPHTTIQAPHLLALAMLRLTAAFIETENGLKRVLQSTLFRIVVHYCCLVVMEFRKQASEHYAPAKKAIDDLNPSSTPIPVTPASGPVDGATKIHNWRTCAGESLQDDKILELRPLMLCTRLLAKIYNVEDESHREWLVQASQIDTATDANHGFFDDAFVKKVFTGSEREIPEIIEKLKVHDHA
eukprot:c12970_g1_i2.p1 GENE.c12970_g1_i2~~c12970_g1_i2.p1  ORF type:complete len:1954 (-),score=472.22 c12970_g1_i2:41-5902(-)